MSGVWLKMNAFFGFCPKKLSIDLNIKPSEVSKKKKPAEIPWPPSGTDFCANLLRVKKHFLLRPVKLVSPCVSSIWLISLSLLRYFSSVSITFTCSDIGPSNLSFILTCSFTRNSFETKSRATTSFVESFDTLLTLLTYIVTSISSSLLSKNFNRTFSSPTIGNPSTELFLVLPESTEFPASTNATDAWRVSCNMLS